MNPGAAAEKLTEASLPSDTDGTLPAPQALEPVVPVSRPPASHERGGSRDDRPPRKGKLLRRPDGPGGRGAFATLALLALPILAENVLHMFVGLTDTWIAGHLPADSEAATAAVGAITYFLWFVHLIAMSIATGATAIVSRAVGARHRSLANSVAGQSVGASLLAGLAMAVVFFLFREPLADLTQLNGQAREFAVYYVGILSLALPFSMMSVSASAVLRGAGDTITPAVVLIVVDVVNIALSASLTFGLAGLPQLGFTGIAVGTVVAYCIGGLLLVAALARGKRVRLHRHRLRPHWHTLRRLLRIGLPNGVEGGLTWIANFLVLASINHVDATNISGAAHIVAIRVESLSYMLGMAISTATATLVGQSLGRREPHQAVAYVRLAFGVALVVMVTWGATFVFAGHRLAAWMSNDPATVSLAARCLYITAFAQPGFAAALIFGGALRGAGDTFSVMLANIASQLCVRLAAVLVVVHVFGYGLAAVWVVLASELTLRGIAMFARFVHGGWKHVEV